MKLDLHRKRSPKKIPAFLTPVIVALGALLALAMIIAAVTAGVYGSLANEEQEIVECKNPKYLATTSAGRVGGVVFTYECDGGYTITIRRYLGR